MKISRVIGYVALVLVVALAASAQEQKGRRGGGGLFPGFFGGRGQSLVGLAAQESVQKDVGLSADVVTKVQTLNTEYLAAAQKENESNPFPRGQDLSEAERTAKMAEYRKKAVEISDKLNGEYTPKLQAIVGADAIKRLKQIQIQTQGAPALANADVAAELKITDEQKKKIGDLVTEYQTKAQGLFTPGGDVQEMLTKQRELFTERDGKLLAALTAEQKEKFTAIKGKEFDVSTLRGGFGGRRGKGNNN